MTILKLLIAFFIFIVPSADAAPKKLTPPAWLKKANGDFLHAMDIGKPYPLQEISQIPESLKDAFPNREPATWSYKGMAGPFLILQIWFSEPYGTDILILKKEKDHLILTDNVGKESSHAILTRIDGQTLYYKENLPLNFVDVPFKTPFFYSTCHGNVYRVFQNNKIALDKRGKLGPVQTLTFDYGVCGAKSFNLAKLLNDDPQLVINEDKTVYAPEFLQAALADFISKKPGPYKEDDLKAIAKHIDQLYLVFKKAHEQKEKKE